MAVEIRQERPNAIPELRAFYAAAGNAAEIGSGDTVISARQDGSLVGLVRLAPEAGVLVLRGMMVSLPNRRRGIGSELLAALEPIIGGRDCYCLCPPRLEGFYGAIGFVRIAETQAPPHLKARWAHYQARDDHQIIMKRPARAMAAG